MIFDANGFPLWIAIVGLMAAAFRLKQTGQRVYPFDRYSTVPLRGVLVMLVCLGHLKVHCPGVSTWFPWMGWATPAVAVFFFLSGYGLCKGYAGKGDGYLSGFIGRSFSKLIRPLAPVVITYSLWLHLHGNFVPQFIRFWQDGNTPVPNTWYVFMH